MLKSKIVRIGLAAGVMVAALVQTAAAQDRFRLGGGLNQECVRELAKTSIEAMDASDIGKQREIAKSCLAVAEKSTGVNSTRARFYAGRALVRLGDYNAARKELEIAVNEGEKYGAQIQPEMRAAQLQLVRAYRLLGRTRNAQEWLENLRLSYQRSSCRPGNCAAEAV
jgi:lipopolysaccharide biosynthesis regulator YciM